MKATFATLALAGAAAAAPHAGHASFHKKDFVSDMTSAITSELSTLTSEAVDVLSKMGAAKAVNSMVPTKDTWIGQATSGAAVVNTIVNKSGKDAYWTCWGPDASWVNVKAPTVSVKVPAGQNVTVSHAIPQDGSQNIGGCTAAFNDTKLVNGQISQSWMEFTFVKDTWASSTYDLSMEPNTAGHNMTIAGDHCASNLETCVFKCKDASAALCGESGTYELINCVGDNRSTYDLFGNPEGGCHGIDATTINQLTTTLHE